MSFVRVSSVVLVLVGLLACGRTGLLLPPEPAVPVAGSTAEPPATPPKDAPCPLPDSPIALPNACVQELCACDRPALTACEWSCWSRVACRIATCNNNPSRRECADGCANSSAAELSLGRCYRASPACTGH